MKTSSILLALSAVCHQALASPVSGLRLTRDVPSSLTSSTITFTGPAIPNGPDVTLTGTAENIYHQLLTLNPHYDADFPTNTTTTTTLSTRAAADCPDCVCTPEGAPVDNFILQCWEGFQYLEKLGTAICRAEARSCARVSCSRGCGIHLCNEMDREVKTSCLNLAYDALDIAKGCGRGEHEGESVYGKIVLGQVFRTVGDERWNTIVKADAGCPPGKGDGF